ncbi:hypothetical protein GUJ93_ZPchr0010g8435 [Zizania palustris]|uniref:Uncharacterized protein n=1 Tax=Zizania palustris TaxID=103762 RepID=A0A8J5W8Q9_ZIZPA|nr:hypothetical protein GUJ93_ZPchr0010g8435 [Zizania palustris]
MLDYSGGSGAATCHDCGNQARRLQPPPVPTCCRAAASTAPPTSRHLGPPLLFYASFRDALPRHVRAPAVFRCVRVTSVEDGGPTTGSRTRRRFLSTATRSGVPLRPQRRRRPRPLPPPATTTPPTPAPAVPSISDLHLGSSSAVPAHLYSGGSVPLILGGLGYGNVMN